MMIPNKFLENLVRIEDLRRSDNGKYRVIGVDKFDSQDFLLGEYDSAKDALRVAREKTRESMDYASDHSVATVFYAYSPDGRYLGGDSWKGE